MALSQNNTIPSMGGRMSELEDRRSAFNIKMSLATNLMTVALALIGAESAIAVFVLDKRDHLL